MAKENSLITVRVGQVIEVESIVDGFSQRKCSQVTLISRSFGEDKVLLHDEAENSSFTFETLPVEQTGKKDWRGRAKWGRVERSLDECGIRYNLGEVPEEKLAELRVRGVRFGDGSIEY